MREFKIVFMPQNKISFIYAVKLNMLCIQEHHSAIKWIQYFCNESNPVNMDTEGATESVRIHVI